MGLLWLGEKRSVWGEKLKKTMEPPRGLLASLWNFIRFLPYFIGLLILGFIKGQYRFLPIWLCFFAYLSFGHKIHFFPQSGYMLVYVTNSLLCESEPVSFSIRICFSIGNFCICDATVLLNWYFSPSVFEEILNLRGYESVNNLTKTCFIISPHMFYNFRGEYRTWGIRYLLLFTKWFGIVFWLNCLLALVVFG